jgi:hypothetical protein
MRPISLIQTLSTFGILLALTSPLRADELTSQAGTTAFHPLAPEIHGFEIDLPICDYASRPAYSVCVAIALQHDPLTQTNYTYSSRCRLDSTGRPLRRWGEDLRVSPQKHAEGGIDESDAPPPQFFRFVPTVAGGQLMWAPDTGLYNVETASGYCSFSSISHGAITVSNGATTTPAQRQEGILVGRIPGVVNNVEDSLIRGSAILTMSSGSTYADQWVELSLHILKEDGTWAKIRSKQVWVDVASQASTKEIEAVVPANSEVRFELRYVAPDGRRSKIDVNEFRLFGAECYENEDMPGMCLE